MYYKHYYKELNSLLSSPVATKMHTMQLALENNMSASLIKLKWHDFSLTVYIIILESIAEYFPTDTISFTLQK